MLQPAGTGARGGGADEGPDVEVRKEDQELINEFGRLNIRFHEVDEDLRVLKVMYIHIQRVDRMICCPHRQRCGHAGGDWH